MVLCTFMEFSLGFSIFEGMKLLQTYSEINSLLQSHSCRSGQPCSFISYQHHSRSLLICLWATSYGWERIFALVEDHQCDGNSKSEVEVG